MSATNSAIGGYFELELPLAKEAFYPQAIAYQSARAAFLALLQQSPGIKRVWMPNYICNAMLAPVYAQKLEVCFYNLDETLSVNTNIALQKSDLLLYVNYFGICEEQCNALFLRFDPAQIVLDCSQAFYAPPRNCFATIYSPRKFFGVPDGGLLVTKLPIFPATIQDTASEARMSHLIKRLAGTAEDGYTDFKHAEDSLEDIEPRQMSALTHRLLNTIDVDTAAARRTHNFNYLHKHLGSTNRLALPQNVVGPQCYPYLPERSVSKDNLIRNKVFVATYWPDVLARVDADSFEHELVNHCIPIPCDQRYDEKSLHRIVDLIGPNDTKA